MQEEREDPTERGVEIRIRLAFPVKTRLGELPAAKRRQDDVAVDALVGRQGVVGYLAEAPGPVAHGGLATAECLRREVLRALVVGREAKHAGPGRRFLVTLVEVVLDQRRERRGRHDATSPTMAKVTD